MGQELLMCCQLTIVHLHQAARNSCLMARIAHGNVYPASMLALVGASMSWPAQKLSMYLFAHVWSCRPERSLRQPSLEEPLIVEGASTPEPMPASWLLRSLSYPYLSPSTRLRACTYTRMHAHAHTTHIHTCIHAHTPHTFVRSCRHTHSHVCTCAHAHIHAHTHTHTHAPPNWRAHHLQACLWWWQSACCQEEGEAWWGGS